MPTSTPAKSLTSSLLKGVAKLFAVVGVLSFLVGGRALHEFSGFDRMFGEMTGIFLAAVLGLIAVLLKGLAERVEDHDNGEPVSLAISDGKKDDESDSDH